MRTEKNGKKEREKERSGDNVLAFVPVEIET